ncbi:MAG: hypothetical protein R3332_08470 [Pseudohongiellaceae bacterium]|nr:hypothetical protein [Pseudohongiellaceae bacterium]
MKTTLNGSTWSISVPGAVIRSTSRDLLFEGYMTLMLNPALPKPDATEPIEMLIQPDLTFKVLRAKRSTSEPQKAA